jgi:hypothetical protein
LLGVGEGELGAQRRNAARRLRGLAAELACRRALEERAGKDSEREPSGDCGDRVLLRELDELVLGLDSLLAGAVDDGRASQVTVARLTGGDFGLDLLAIGVGNRISPVKSVSSAERPSGSRGSAPASGSSRSATHPRIGLRANHRTSAAVPTATQPLLVSA